MKSSESQDAAVAVIDPPSAGVRNQSAKKLRVLINLPAGFFSSPVLKSTFARLRKFATVQQTSHNTAAEIAPDLARADALIMWSWPAYTHDLLDQAPKLQFVGHLDIGQKAAKVALERALPVSVTRRAFSPAVAEMALSLTLSTLRQTSNYHAAMRQGREAWVKKFPDDIPADERELTGRSVGIIGFGAVGQRFAELLAPFRCSLRVYDPYLSSEAAAKFNAVGTDLNKLIRSSDVVVLCAASNSGSRHLLGQAEIDAFRKGAVFINVARAALVDTAALIERLKAQDMYAAIDVFDLEPLQRSSPLRKLPNVFLTPHRAGGTLGSVERIISMLVDDLEAHLNGRPRQYALSSKMIPALDA
jgi:phosphoglycerate dehydrogenase-like enzyme